MSAWIWRGVAVVVRDGCQLATDVYLPGHPGTVGRLPALLLRTPYDRLSPQQQEAAQEFARAGYAMVVQDCRGRFGSDGHFVLGQHEAEDGYDTVEWVARQPWCNGKVATLGTSYMAWVQSALASLAPPHLRAMWVHEGLANGLEESVRQGGAFELRWMGWAFYGAATDPRSPASVRDYLAHIDLRDWLGVHLPEPGHGPLRHVPGYDAWLYEYRTTGLAGDLWNRRGLNVERYWGPHADVPTVYSGGWYDSYTRATLRNFAGLSAMKSAPLQLLMGPWTHGTAETELSWAGDIDLGSTAPVNFFQLRREWFDYHLKGVGQNPLPSVRYFLMGGGSGAKTRDGRLDHGGRWCESRQWPPAATTMSCWFLSQHGRLEELPPKTTGSVRYRFDPRSPVPTIGGNISFLSRLLPVDPQMGSVPVMDRLVPISPIGGQDQVTRPGLFGARPPYGPLIGRSDVVSFVTDPLRDPVVLTGPVEVVLWVTTDGGDTDFTAKLVDWYPPSPDYPDGYALNITDGIQRLRFSRGYDTECFLAPGEVREIRIALYPSANQFMAGHRIRLDISSSNFPRFDLNPNTGAPLGETRLWRSAINRVLWGPQHLSRVELTVQATVE